MVQTVPDAMWITLLNLSGESPLAHYSLLGQIMCMLMGLVVPDVGSTAGALICCSSSLC